MAWQMIGMQTKLLQDVALCASAAVRMVVSFLLPSNLSPPRNMRKRLAAFTSIAFGGKRRTAAILPVLIPFNFWSPWSLSALLSKRRTVFVAISRASDLRQCRRLRLSVKSSSRLSWDSQAPSHAISRRTSRSSLGEFLQAPSRRSLANT